ncbi:MAG: hypothetical protein PHR16_06595 [Methylovulum sp.]|nr:hypothetical protein [Methylovulum sp.]
MKKALTTEFKTRLWDTVRAIEQTSQVEIVVVIRSRSEDYRDIALLCGIIGALLSFSYIMFSSDLFEDWLVYCAPILGFAIGYALAHWPRITRLGVGKQRLQRSVEIMARALFQKAGIRHTRAKIGVLIYCSWLEKSVYILPDRGAEMALPAEEWQRLRAEFQGIFISRKPAEALITQLHNVQPLFNRYLPSLANDINELHDAMEIDL